MYSEMLPELFGESRWYKSGKVAVSLSKPSLSGSFLRFITFEKLVEGFSLSFYSHVIKKKFCAFVFDVVLEHYPQYNMIQLLLWDNFNGIGHSYTAKRERPPFTNMV